MQTAKARMEAAFLESDADGDGRLNRQESDAFYTKLQEQARERGEFASTFEDGLAENYRLANCVSAEEGYTYAEFQLHWGPVIGFWEQLKAAKDAA